ncbi:hypothetical protein MVEG_00411 [Podila verticillata NRRL 6337]|nr:hypothetical protein MVEG_00411 [Podila verticillata NRRL 6337]
MSRVLQHRLRITIIFLSFIILICLAAYFGQIKAIDGNLEFVWQTICVIAIPLITFSCYICSIRSHVIVHKFVRAAPLLAITGLWLYLNCDTLNFFITSNLDFSCDGGPSYYMGICIANRISIVLGIVCACLILIEVAVTLRQGPIVPVQPKDVIIVSPLEMQQQQQFQQQQFQQQQLQQQHYSYIAPQPGNLTNPYQQQPFQQYPQYPPQQQPQFQSANGFVSGTPKYEDQSNLYGQQQQQYQQQYYQQQQQQYQYPVPGSTVTATPQPGGQPIAPYPSPGTSVAVSPVLPVGGYSTTSAPPHTYA